MSEERNCSLLLNHLGFCWRYAVRALNCCENEGLKDSRENMVEIVAKISQVMELHDALENPTSTEPQ